MAVPTRRPPPGAEIPTPELHKESTSPPDSAKLKTQKGDLSSIAKKSAGLSRVEFQDPPFMSIREEVESQERQLGHSYTDLHLPLDPTESLPAQELATTLTALSRLHTKCRLIAAGRYADLMQYTQMHDPQFDQEAPLLVTKLVLGEG